MRDPKMSRSGENKRHMVAEWMERFYDLFWDWNVYKVTVEVGEDVGSLYDVVAFEKPYTHYVVRDYCEDVVKSDDMTIWYCGESSGVDMRQYRVYVFTSDILLSLREDCRFNSDDKVEYWERVRAVIQEDWEKRGRNGHADSRR